MSLHARYADHCRDLAVRLRQRKPLKPFEAKMLAKLLDSVEQWLRDTDKAVEQLAARDYEDWP